MFLVLVVHLVTVLAAEPSEGCIADADCEEDRICDANTCRESPVQVHAGLHPLPSLQDGWTDRDLAALDEIVGDARFVGLGESIHTSGGYYEAKRQMFQHLVERSGFRVLAMETSWKAAEIAERYVASCEGSMLDAVGSLYPTFADRSTGDLLTWMCEWNQDHPDDPLAFTGFDVKQAPLDRVRLDFLLTDNAPEAPKKWLLACNNSAERPTRSCGRALDALDVALADANWEGASEARRCVIGLRATMAKTVPSYHARDLGMADVFSSLVTDELVGKRVAIWAHNGHVARDWAHSTNSLPFISFGTHLVERYGKDYVAIGFVGGDVLVNWFPGAPDQHVEELEPGTVEHRLHALGVNAALVDLRTTTLFSKHEVWRLGGAGVVPRDQFDALLYLDHSRAMLPLSRVTGGYVSLAGLPAPWLLPPEAIVGIGHLRYHVPGVNLASSVAAYVKMTEYTGHSLVSQTNEGSATTLVLDWTLDDATTELRIAEVGDGVDIEMRWAPPPWVQTLAEIHALDAGALAVMGRLASDGASLMLADGSLSVEPGTFPVGWGGLFLSATCRVEDDRVGPCLKILPARPPAK